MHPPTSAIVCWGLISTGNRILLRDWSAAEPIYVVSILTTLTWLFTMIDSGFFIAGVMSRTTIGITIAIALLRDRANSDVTATPQ
ncbi:hypothetical protein [Burkholderia gladioli]|uniref:hypothetical protein n=1 Tax=Burkholderia gladioli TaxID=28095 RepID=UPI002652EDA4|nr:hypothetical protein [Burkholderia gladioli]MDN7726665.1 hypothetical protein [Burkholderia gladioli]